MRCKEACCAWSANACKRTSTLHVRHFRHDEPSVLDMQVCCVTQPSDCGSLEHVVEKQSRSSQGKATSYKTQEGQEVTQSDLRGNAFCEIFYQWASFSDCPDHDLSLSDEDYASILNVQFVSLVAESILLGLCRPCHLNLLSKSNLCKNAFFFSNFAARNRCIEHCACFVTQNYGRLVIKER